MKIKEVIKTFKFLLPIYEKELQLKPTEKRNPALDEGICLAILAISRLCIQNLTLTDFSFYRELTVDLQWHYKNIFTYNAIPGTPSKYLCTIGERTKTHKSYLEKCIKPRVEFLKDEIQYLEYLIYIGYTDI